MYAQLGDIIFEGLKGFTEFSDSRSINLAEHPVIEGAPKLQKIGRNLKELSFGLLLHASFCNPEGELDALDTAMEEARVMPLVLGNGAYVGDFVVESVERTTQLTDKVGNIISLQANVRLKESYTADALQRRALAARQAAFATTAGGAVPVRIITAAKPSDGLAAMAEVKLAQLEAATITSNVSRAGVFAAEVDSLVSRTSRSLDNIEAAMDRLQDKIVNPVLSAYTLSMPAAVNAVRTAAINFQAALPWPTISDAQGLSQALNASVTNLNKSASPLIQALAVRRI